jgi:hypothetical protein
MDRSPERPIQPRGNYLSTGPTGEDRLTGSVQRQWQLHGCSAGSWDPPKPEPPSSTEERLRRMTLEQREQDACELYERAQRVLRDDRQRAAQGAVFEDDDARNGQTREGWSGLC